MLQKIFYFTCCLLLLSCNNGKNEKGDEETKTDDIFIILPDEVISNLHLCTEMPGAPDSIKAGRKQASGKRWLFWKQTKKQLYISFTDGDKKVQEKVKQTAKEWEKYCGKEFIFSDFPNQATEADITISFKDKTSWSLIGTDSKTTVPSMNLGWLTINTSDEEYKRVVLHEFGHALGLVHEHQNPDNNPIQWNKENVYAFYKQKFGWSKKVTYANFFEKYTVNQMNSSDFDAKSIMMYEIPELFTTNGFHTIANTQLSETDKEWIGRIYPKLN
jgi:serralysin